MDDARRSNNVLRALSLWTRRQWLAAAGFTGGSICSLGVDRHHPQLDLSREIPTCGGTPGVDRDLAVGRSRGHLRAAHAGGEQAKVTKRDAVPGAQHVGAVLAWFAVGLPGLQQLALLRSGVRRSTASVPRSPSSRCSPSPCQVLPSWCGCVARFLAPCRTQHRREECTYERNQATRAPAPRSAGAGRDERLVGELRGER